MTIESKAAFELAAQLPAGDKVTDRDLKVIEIAVDVCRKQRAEDYDIIVPPDVRKRDRVPTVLR
jgi:hypothetical protein